MAKQNSQTADGDNVYARLLDDIAAGHFPGGTRLKINELAARYQTSTNPVREALRLLQGEGYVEFEANKGATVSRVDVNTIRDTYEILQVLEPYFVSWFAEYGTPQQIRALEDIQDELEALDSPVRERVTPLDNRFHNLICDQHYNKRAANVWRSQRSALRAFAAKLPIGRNRFKAICIEHRTLIDAFKRHDSEAATAIIRSHIDHAGQHLYEQIRLHDLRSNGVAGA